MATRIDPDKLRGRLREFDRGTILIVAERALEALPPSKRAAIVADFLRIEDLAPDPEPEGICRAPHQPAGRPVLVGRYRVGRILGVGGDGRSSSPRRTSR